MILIFHCKLSILMLQLGMGYICWHWYVAEDLISIILMILTVWFKIILSQLCFPCYLKLRQEFTFLQLVHYSRIGKHYSDLLDRSQLLVQMLLQQGDVAPRLRNIHFSNGNRPFPFYADIYRTWLWATLWYLIRNGNCLPFVSPWAHPRFFFWRCVCCSSF